jgi:hypothetical protein
MHEVGELGELAVVLQVGAPILGVDLPDLLRRQLGFVPEQKARAILEGGEVSRVERVNVVAVSGEIQLPHDPRRQQAHHV